MSVAPRDISIVIPTYGREEVLVQTLNQLLSLRVRAGALLVVDQTVKHEIPTEKRLQEWSTDGIIQWIRLKIPSIPKAMNTGLIEAKTNYVLFLDDDIIPVDNIVSVYAAVMNELSDPGVWCIAGQVRQPGEEELNGEESGGRFLFNSGRRSFISDVMAGNLCVVRGRALEIGGFDENFMGVAYRFETEFAQRVIRAGGKIIFEPKASIQHLRIASGGTRTYGNHLTSSSPYHGVGDYYFALRQGISLKTLIYMLRRPFREVMTRFHLRHPWWIPVKFTGEMRAMLLALLLYLRGPRYISPTISDAEESCKYIS
ncbi:MAG: glycosyltransferase family 2 protein [Thermodesulfovibrionales bacterium]